VSHDDKKGVTLCNDPWHQPTAAEIRAKEAKDAASSSVEPHDLRLATGMLEGYMRQAAAHPGDVETLIPAIGETLRRLVAHASATLPQNAREILIEARAWLDVAASSGIQSRDDMNLPTPNAEHCHALSGRIYNLLMGIAEGAAKNG
jgi:hypothetical protein